MESKNFKEEMNMTKKSKSVHSSSGGLVIGRLAGESIVIGGAIRVQVLRDDSGLVRLRVEAPREVNIAREELFEGELDVHALYESLGEAIKSKS